MNVGDYITISHVIGQYIPDCSEWKRDMEVIRVRYMPCDAGDPLCVTAICLPYLLVSTPSGKHEMVDLRKQQIARLDQSFGVTAFAKLDERLKTKKKAKKKKKRKRK